MGDSTTARTRMARPETSGLEVLPVADLPEVGEGDDLGALIAAAVALRDDDVVVIAQKVVSKAEGRIADLDGVEPTPEARELAGRVGKEAALVQLVLDESRAVIRAERGVLIVETGHGWICANAGIDSSNVPGERAVALLPLDPDASARRLRAEIGRATGVRPGVIVSDSFGRPWRLGQTEVAIGCAGVTPVDDWRERTDRQGTVLAVTAIAIADELACTADLVRDKASGTPVAVVRGAGRHVTADDGPGAAALRRPEPDDLFR